MNSLEDMIREVAIVAVQSKDTGAQVGAVIVAADGRILPEACNELPEGVLDSAVRRTRPAKYFFTEHAERNAIYHAAKHGYKLAGATIYQSWFPCADCARSIIQSGIRRVVAQRHNFEDPRWGESLTAARHMFREAGVAVEFY